jgi:hypothetical protein
LNRTDEEFVDVGKMGALELERTVVASQDTTKNALLAAFRSVQQFSHATLHVFITVGKAI